MKVSVIVATALAVGLSSIAASAATLGFPDPSISVKVTGKEAKSAKVEEKKPAAKKSAAVKKKTVKAKTTSAMAPSKKKVVAANAAKPRVKARINKKAKGTPGVDMTTTASIAKPSGKGRAYGAIVSRYAAAYGVPASLAHAVITVESNYRVDARGSAGEIGLMQIKPATARMMGYSGSANGLFNPETNIKYGVKYLAKAHELGGGSTCGTILRYNAGHGAKRMNPISAAYCAKVKRQLGS